MAAAVKVPVTVKCRIGVDEQAPREALAALVERIEAAGAAAVVVHARKAWLEGLRPKDNRTGPPLDYPLVYDMKAAHPDLAVVVNGGVADLEAARGHLRFVDGAMVGRAAYQNPEMLLGVDPELFGEPAPLADAFEAVEAYLPYVARELARGARLGEMTRHMLGLFAGRPGARRFRQTLTTLAVRPGAGVSELREAVAAVARVARAPLAEAV
jgi:tRNA-dihydrouridine synthase A